MATVSVRLASPRISRHPPSSTSTLPTAWEITNLCVIIVIISITPCSGKMSSHPKHWHFPQALCDPLAALSCDLCQMQLHKPLCTCAGQSLKAGGAHFVISSCTSFPRPERMFILLSPLLHASLPGWGLN